jgi:hypothetical protein
LECIAIGWPVPPLFLYSVLCILVLEMKIWIYWSKSNSWIYFFIYFKIKTEKCTGLNKVLYVLGLRISGHREEQSFTCLGPYDRCSSWGTKFYMSWALGSVLIVRNKVLHVLGLTISAHREEQSFTCLGLYDECSSWGTKFYMSWALGSVLIVRTTSIAEIVLHMNDKQ